MKAHVILMMKNREEWANMGSIIRKDLSYYGINLDFEFDIVDSKSDKPARPRSTVYFQ